MACLPRQHNDNDDDGGSETNPIKAQLELGEPIPEVVAEGARDRKGHNVHANLSCVLFGPPTTSQETGLVLATGEAPGP